MKKRNWIISLFVIGVTVGSASAVYEVEESNYTIQALLGGVRYDDLVFTNPDSSGDDVTIDMSTIPQLGGAWASKPKGEKFQYGLECSFLMGFKIDDFSYWANSGSGTAYVNVSASMWMFDFAGGAYANLPLGDKLRIYAGAGPLMVYANYRSELDYTDQTPNSTQSDSVFGLGVYARTGLELRLKEYAWLGAGVRGTWNSLDFSEVGGETDLSGIAVFLTYTAGL